MAYVTGGNNIGRVGSLLHVERHQGSFDIAHLRDANGKTFATRSGNIFIIGNKKSEITLPASEGLYLNILEEKAKREESRKKSTKWNDLFPKIYLIFSIFFYFLFLFTYKYIKDLKDFKKILKENS